MTPVVPPAEKAKRSIICTNVEELIFENSEEEIAEEIQISNTWAEIQKVTKFPPRGRNNIMKIEFTDHSMAERAKDHGLLMFYISIANHQIKRESYIEIKNCYKCYTIEDHDTQDNTYKICSECSALDHTWKECKSTQKQCVNCGGQHRTPAMKCPIRKQAYRTKQQAERNTPNTTYANAASTPTNNTATPTHQAQTIQASITT